MTRRSPATISRNSPNGWSRGVSSAVSVPPALGRPEGDCRADYQDAGGREHQAAGDGPDYPEQLDDAAGPRPHLRGLQLLQELAPEWLHHQNGAHN